MQETEYYIMSNIDRKNTSGNTENFDALFGEFSQEEVKRIINSIYKGIQHEKENNKCFRGF